VDSEEENGGALKTKTSDRYLNDLMFAGFGVVEKRYAKHHNTRNRRNNVKSEIAHFLLFIAKTKIAVATRPIIRYAKNRGLMKCSYPKH